MITNRKLRAALAVVCAFMLLCSAALLSSCKKSDGGNSGSEKKDSKESIVYRTEDAFVAGKCYALTDLQAEDEEYDADMIKFMYDIDDVSDYMAIYFEESGKAYVLSVIYGKKVLEGTWTYDENGITLNVDSDTFKIEDAGNGTITTVQADEDGEEFQLTLKEIDEAPEELAEYAE